MSAEHSLGLQHQTQAAIPSWGSLLYIYGILQVPTLSAFLVGTNLLVWSSARINYVFIFGKEPRNTPLYLIVLDQLYRVGY
jgi:hypothetical protein